MADAGVTAPGVVIPDIVAYSASHFLAVGGRIEIDMLLFECPPESFYPYVVKASAPAVHAYRYSILSESFNPFAASVLASLV